MNHNIFIRASPLSGLQWNPHYYFRPSTGRRLHREASADLLGTFAHNAHSKVLARVLKLGRIESAAIIFNLDLRLIGVRGDAHAHRVSVRVFSHVVERFLNDAQQLNLDDGRECACLQRLGDTQFCVDPIVLAESPEVLF